MMTRKLIIAGAGILVAAFLSVMVLSENDPPDYSYYEISKGDFEIVVTVTGELEAENSLAIEGPAALQDRNVRLRGVPIQDLIPEGSIVEEGDWVATLDRTEAGLSLSELEEQMLAEEAKYNSAVLDTAIRLSGLRDELINLEHSVEEMRLRLEQSEYEPPATIRQAEIDLERAVRTLEQAEQNFSLYERDATEQLREARLDLETATRHYQALSELLDQFVITAPAPGMVIYHREWSGEKRAVGSTINSRDLTVAVMPDLTSLVSRAFVNEMDVDLVHEGQPVRIGIDAYPEREYSGRVIQVANVGEEHPNTDVRVFEVKILIDRIDDILRPAMTTSNTIVTGHFEDVYSVPLAAIHYADGVPYVYKNNGTRQIVRTGAFNDNFIVIEKGLEEGEAVYLEVPERADRFRFTGSELLTAE